MYNKTDSAGCSFYAVCNHHCDIDRFQGACPTSPPTEASSTPAASPSQPQGCDLIVPPRQVRLLPVAQLAGSLWPPELSPGSSGWRVALGVETGTAPREAGMQGRPPGREGSGAVAGLWGRFHGPSQ